MRSRRLNFVDLMLSLFNVLGLVAMLNQNDKVRGILYRKLAGTGGNLAVHRHVGVPGIITKSDLKLNSERGSKLLR